MPLHAVESASTLTEKAHKSYFRGRISKAIKLYEQAISHDPKFIPAYLSCAISHRTLGNNGKAAELLEKVSKIAPQMVDIKVELGWLYFHDQRFDQARSLFSEALDNDKRHAGALLGLGATLLRSGQQNRSIKVLKDLNKLRPNFAAARFLIGRAYQLDSHLERSVENYLIALKKDWTFAESREHLAKALKDLGENKKAWQQYKRLISMDPRNSSARRSFDELSKIVPDESKEIVPLRPLELTPAIPISVPDKGETVRVGIWAVRGGRPPKLGSLTFEVGGTFDVIGTKTGKVYGTGQKGELWKARHYRYRLSEIVTPDGEKLGPFKYGVRIKPRDPNQVILVQGVTNMNGSPRVRLKGREYRGALVIMPGRRGGIYPVNEVPVEEYLLGVLPSEMPADWPMEALKAQAVIARNQALLRKKRIRLHRRQRYDICDSQHCQVYKGLRVESEKTRQAVEETSGKFLYSGKRLAQSYYHSSCGGHTQSSKDIKGWSRVRYLTGRPDMIHGEVFPTATPWTLNGWIKGVPRANCNLGEMVPTSGFRWLRIIPRKMLERKLNRKFRIGKLKAIIPLKRSPSGYTNEVLIKGSRRRVILRKEHRIRHYLGLESMRSTLFLIETYKDSSGNPEEFWFYGGGWGHGVGLCQTGAAGLAQNAGKNYEEILSFYYPHTEIRQARR